MVDFHGLTFARILLANDRGEAESVPCEQSREGFPRAADVYTQVVFLENDPNKHKRVRPRSCGLDRAEAVRWFPRMSETRPLATGDGRR